MDGVGFTIFQLTLLEILLPTADVFGDIYFAISALRLHIFGTGCLTLLPVILNMICNIYNWFSNDYDTPKERRFTWILVLLNLWPQYQVLKLLLLIIGGKSKEIYLPSKHKIKMELCFTEPFMVAVPQFFISSCVGMGLPYKFHCLNIFGGTVVGISTNDMYKLKHLISALVGMKGIIDYLHNGPVKITSNTKCGTVVLAIPLVFYLITSYIAKLFVWLVAREISETGSSLGIWIASLVSILFPAVISIGPLIRVLGLKKCTKIFLGQPELFVLSLTTEYALGPIEEEINYRSCLWCCCNCWLSCTWGCCCQQCKPEKTMNLTISRRMSWNKMFYMIIPLYIIPLYTLYHLYILSVSSTIPTNEYITHCIPPGERGPPEPPDIRIGISLFVWFLLGLACFAITLHCAKSKGVLHLEVTENMKDMSKEEMRITAPNGFYVQAGIEKSELTYDDKQDFQNIENSKGALDEDLAPKAASAVDLQILNKAHGIMNEHKLGLGINSVVRIDIGQPKSIYMI